MKNKKEKKIKKTLGMKEIKKEIFSYFEKFDNFYYQLDKKSKNYLILMPILVIGFILYYVFWPMFYNNYKSTLKNYKKEEQNLNLQKIQYNSSKKYNEFLEKEMVSLKKKFLLYENQARFLFNLLNVSILPMKIEKSNLINFYYSTINDADKLKLNIADLIIRNYDKNKISKQLKKQEFINFSKNKKEEKFNVNNYFIEYFTHDKSLFKNTLLSNVINFKNGIELTKKNNIIEPVKFYYFHLNGNFDSFLKFIYDIENTKKFIFINDLIFEPNNYYLVVKVEGLNKNFIVKVIKTEKNIFNLTKKGNTNE